MPHVTPREEQRTIGDLLAADMEAQGMKIRTLARRLAGEDASHDQIENKRKSVRGWLRGKVLPNDESAAELARALQQPPERYVTIREETKRQRRDELAALREELAAARGQIARLEGRVEELEQDRRRPGQRAAGDPE